MASSEALPTVSATVRRVLLGNNNSPMRVAAIWEAVHQTYPDMTRSHFRGKIMRQLVKRQEVESDAVSVPGLSPRRHGPASTSCRAPHAYASVLVVWVCSLSSSWFWKLAGEAGSGQSTR